MIVDDPRKPSLATLPGNELKYISVLFADQCGSTEQVSSYDPEEAQQYLGQVLSLMSEAVVAYGGTINSMFGDGLLAFFGAPIAQEDHALRACLAALDMQRRAALASRSGHPLMLRVGVSSGEVLVGTPGVPFVGQYRADGNTMHLASRLESEAEPGTVLVSGSTVRLTGEQIEAVPLGARMIRGIRGEIEVYQLVTTGQRSPAAPLARRRQMSPLVGRASLLAKLEATADQVLSGSMRALALRGEPGIGKSRLRIELARRLDAKFLVHCTAAHSYTSQVSFGVVTTLVRELLGVPLDMELEPQREAAHAIVAGWPGDADHHRSTVFDLLELGTPDQSWLALPPPARSRRIADLVFWLITRRLAASPVMIVVEDVFQADRESERLIESLARRLRNMPVLFFFTYRQDCNRRWMDASWLVEYTVGPLPEDEMAQLAVGMLGDDASLRPIVDLLIERADGNPFFLEQLAITLIDNGTLVGAPRAYVSLGQQTMVSVPGSITAVIAARIDRLPAGSKASLEAAAILGEPASSALIARMRGIERGEAENQLGLAVSLGMLVVPAPSDQPRYRFKHPLMQEVVAGALTRPRRRMLHRAAFVAMKEQQGDSSVERAALLAHHAYNGEDWASAARFAQVSMARSIARSANRDAVRVFELGLDAVKRLVPDTSVLELEFSLCAESLGALLPLGKIDACIANLLRAEAIAQQLDDVRRLAAVSLQMALIQWTKGSYALAMAAADKAAVAAEAADSRSVQMAARHARMTILHGMGRFRDVIVEARAILADFADELQKLELIHGWAVIAAINVRVFLADALWRVDEVEEAQRVCSGAYVDLNRNAHVFSRVLVDFVQGEIWNVEGRYDEAARLFSEALGICITQDNVAMVPVFTAALAAAMARSGQPTEAIAMLDKGIADKLYLQGGRYNDFYFPMNLAIALAEAGRYDEARDSAEAALAVAAAFEQLGHRAQALFELAEIECASGRPAQGLMRYREAVVRADQCGMLLVRRRALERIEQVDDSMRLLDTLQQRDGPVR